MSENENKMKDIENKMSENENKMSENENKTSENDYRMPDIDNTKLEEVMASYAEKQDKERLSQLVFALKDTELFIPTMIKPNNEGLKPYIIKNPEGDLYMPSFTSIKKIPLDQKYQGMLKMKYMQCVSLLLDNPSQVLGIVLNPYHDNLILKTQMLELSRQVEQQAAQAKPKAITMKLEDFRMVTRHFVEFHQIPEKLFTQKLDFIQSVTSELLCEMYRVPYVEAKQEGQCPYAPKQFEMMELNIREDLNIMQVVVPSQHLYKTNCREIYFVWNPQTENVSYYLIVKGTEEDEEEFYLGVVNEDYSYDRLEAAPTEGNVLSRIMELFETSQEEQEE